MGVDHGGDDIGMSQSFLHRPDFITCFKKMRGKELVLSLAKEMAQGIVDIHDFNHQNPFDFNRLGKNQACNDRRNYHIII